MRLMGIAALGPRRKTSKPAPGHRIYPYLLRNLTIERANHVWAADITYIPIGRGFLYLVAIIDWASRAVLAWRLSNTLDVSFCLAALEEALAKFGRPEIYCEPWTPFCLSSGDSCSVDLPATLSDEREDLSGEVTLQGSNGVEFGMPFGYPSSNIVLGSLVGP
jgi:transposase InsO family protein